MEFFLILVIVVVALLAYFIGKMIESRKWEERIKYIRRESVEKSRQVLGGKFAENLSPYFPDFKYDPTEIRFIGTPVDYIVFKGLSNKQPEEIVFLEVKSGEAKLSDVQRKLKKLVDEKKISWDEYRVPKNATK